MSISPDQIDLTPDQRQQLAWLAQQTGKSWNVILEEALSTFEHVALPKTEHGETVYEALLRLGLLGSVSVGPADLSTNPKYMEGFGRRER